MSLRSPPQKDRSVATALIRLCRYLQYRGECIYPYTWIITELAKLHSQQPSRFDWQSLGIRFRELEDEVARREILAGDLIAQEIRFDNRSNNKIFREIYRDAHDRFEDEYRSERPDWRSVIRMLKADDGGFWRLSMSVYKRVTGRELS
jgi:hypothetical protein